MNADGRVVGGSCFRVVGLVEVAVLETEVRLRQCDALELLVLQVVNLFIVVRCFAAGVELLRVARGVDLDEADGHRTPG